VNDSPDREHRAVLLMAYGGPERLEDVEPFLLDVRGGRPTPPELVAEVRARYAAIGGGSPLLRITRQQAAALEARLNAEDAGDREWRVFAGMRHWHPYVAEAVLEIAAAGIRRGVALCLAPQYSRMSIGAYLRSLDQALAALPEGERPELARVESWGDHPLFLDALAEKVEEAFGRLPAGADPKVIFTAHSLPARIVAAGDPYDAQLRATAAAVADRAAARLGRPLDCTFCYQSAAAGATDWLGPSIEEEVVRLARAGHRHLVVCPVGFVADHVEVLYDLDVEARRLAEAAGASLHRTASLNASPTFVAALADVVRRAAAGQPG
jgi:ferrochelatase